MIVSIIRQTEQASNLASNVCLVFTSFCFFLVSVDGSEMNFDVEELNRMERD